MRWVLMRDERASGIPHLTPTLSPLKGGEGDFLVKG